MNEYPQHQPQKMSTGKKIGLFGCALPFVGLLMMGGCGAVIASMSDTDTSTSSESADAEASPSSEPEAEAEEVVEDEEAGEEDGFVVVSDGIHRIGDDIPAGDYTTAGPESDSLSGMCYYARLSGTSGEFDEIIANNNLQGSGTVTVSESDVALELTGGCDWELMD